MNELTVPPIAQNNPAPYAIAVYPELFVVIFPLWLTQLAEAKLELLYNDTAEAEPLPPTATK